MHLNVRITRGRSLLPIQPTLNSASVKGVPLFQKAPLGIPPDDIPVDLDTYAGRLRAFLDTFLQSEGAQAGSQMDMLRLFFMVNDLKSARALMKRMPQCGDVRMLRFIADHTGPTHALDERYSVRLGQEIPPERPKPTDHATAGRILQICSGIDEKTRCIFALEVMGLLPPEKLPTIIGGLGIASEYTRVYIGAKACERLAACRLEKMAAYMLVSTAMQLEGGQDLKAKEELVRLALSHVPHGRWRKRVLQLFDSMCAAEVQQPGRACIDTTSMAEDHRVRAPLSVHSQNPIFSFNLFKRRHEDWCAGKLCISNKDRVPIDGIFTKSARFIPVFGDGPAMRVDLSAEHLFYGAAEKGRDVELDCFLLSDGRRVAINKSFRLVEREGSLALEQIRYAGSQAIWTFEITGQPRAIALDKAYGHLQRDGGRVKVYLNANINAFSVEVEISSGIFEEQNFYA